MIRIYTHLQSLRSDESGAVAIEYVLIAGLIAAAIIAATAQFGSDLKAAFDSLGTSLGTHTTF